MKKYRVPYGTQLGEGRSHTRSLAPGALFPSQFGFGQRSPAQPARRTLPLQHSIKPSSASRVRNGRSRALGLEFSAACDARTLQEKPTSGLKERV
jgi:hypothetical protein